MLRKILLNGFYFSGLQAATAPVTQGIGSILMLHHVQNIECKPFSPNCHLSVSPEFLDAVILRLKLEGYEFVSMDEVVDRLKNPEAAKSEKPFLCVTLDDGYRNNLENAVPIFRRHEVPYTIYVAPGLTEGKHTLWWEDLEIVIASRKKVIVEFPDGPATFITATPKQKLQAYKALIHRLVLDSSEPQQRQIIADLCVKYNHDAVAHAKSSIMTWKMLQKLNKDPLCTLGAHTIGHFALAKLSRDEAIQEMSNSRALIEEKTGKKAKHFAYPYGYPVAAAEREFELARELGFESAVTTRHGVVYEDHEKHLCALPRISVNGSHQSMRYIHTLLSGLPTRVKNAGGKLDIA
ncbi:MAG: polysaccharide deacetylase family protein [Pseudomonadota bacterium]